MLLSEKSREAEPSQHHGTPHGALRPTSFVEKRTERETEDIQRHCIQEHSDCRGHDLLNPGKHCSIAPDSYRTGLGSQRHVRTENVVNELVLTWPDSATTVGFEV